MESATYTCGKLTVGRPKTSGSVRDVPIPAFVAEALSAECVGKGPDDLVFPGRNQQYMVPVHPTRSWFATAVRRSNIQRVTPHDLRHTCASLAVSAGVNVLALSRMLGHAQPSITLDTYADLFDSDLDAAAAVMHGRYGQSVPISCPQGSIKGS
jgi:integrase